MTDKQFEEFLRNAAQDYNRPPEEAPREEIWADIDEARNGGWQRTQWRDATPWWALGRSIAATVALWVFPLTAVAGGAALAINHWTDDGEHELASIAVEHGHGEDHHAEHSHSHGQHAECNDIDTRVAALNALLHMDTEQAMPILMDVLERRDACSVELRRRAVFLVSQHETGETVDILLSAALDDPDEEVRLQAVFWIGQLSGDESVSALETVMQESDNIEIQKKVVFSLSQHGSRRAMRILRDLALDSRAHEEVREQAIFWLGQEGSGEDASMLMDLFDELDSDALREKIVFSVSQNDTRQAEQWLLGVARDRSVSMDVRENAVFWLGQRDSDAAVTALGTVLREEGPELQKKAVFSLSQHGSYRAMELLRDVVVDSDAHQETREQAIFWLGQEGSSEDVELLMEMYDRLEVLELKEKIIFAVSQNSDRDGVEWLIGLAHDESELVELRKDALFWAGQEGDVDAAELRELYEDVEEFELKQHVIFVISQLDNSDAVTELMEIARNETNDDLRDKAIFWLGQSDDERAAEFLMELINRPLR